MNSEKAGRLSKGSRGEVSYSEGHPACDCRRSGDWRIHRVYAALRSQKGYLLRCNPIAAVIAVSLHDVALPLWPVVLRMQYDIGFWVLSNPHHFPPKDGDAPHSCWRDVEMDNVL